MNATYSDLDFKLTITPEGTIKKQYDVDAIVQSIKTILTTMKGERVMNPEFGSNLGAMLFEPMDNIQADLIRGEIFKSITEWEDRVFINNITVVPDYDNSIYVVTINYIVRTTGNEDSLTFGIRNNV